MGADDEVKLVVRLADGALEVSAAGRTARLRWPDVESAVQQIGVLVGDLVDQQRRVVVMLGQGLASLRKRLREHLAEDVRRGALRFEELDEDDDELSFAVGMPKGLENTGVGRPSRMPISDDGPPPPSDARGPSVIGVVHGKPPSPDDVEPPKPTPIVEPAPGRSVGIVLHRRGFKSELPGEAHEPTRVRHTTRLAAGRAYQLRVQIGPLRDDSLIEVAPPSIDGLVPARPDGNTLEVAVFGLDFAVTSKHAVRALWLPATGASQVLEFNLTAPAKAGPARLRVMVSHADHLLQSFVVSAEIAHGEERAPARTVIAKLEHSATRRFDNLAALRPRAATAVINDDPSGDHSITLKRGDATCTFAFTDAQVRAAAERVRALLEQAVHAPAFEEPPPLRTSDAFGARVAAYKEQIRTLAVYGKQLYLALSSKTNAAGRELLRELAKLPDQRLQLVHVTRSLVIPWATIYDGWLPRDLKVAGLDVCLGPPEGGPPCGHDGTEQLICVTRFWGMRHYLELQLGDPRKVDAITTFQAPPDRRQLRILQGKRLRDEHFLPDDYTKLLAQPDVAWNGDVYDLLAAAKRPAVFVAMGHFSIEEPAPGSHVHTIDLVPETLTDTGVSQLVIEEGDWKDPHSIVLLMACSSAVAASDALIGMIDAFASAGAAAIIGTESTVYPRLSARAACLLYQQLVDGNGKLAEAMRALRWTLARDATPLAFTFTAYGNADLAREDAA